MNFRWIDFGRVRPSKKESALPRRAKKRRPAHYMVPIRGTFDATAPFDALPAVAASRSPEQHARLAAAEAKVAEEMSNLERLRDRVFVATNHTSTATVQQPGRPTSHIPREFIEGRHVKKALPPSAVAAYERTHGRMPRASSVSLPAACLPVGGSSTWQDSKPHYESATVRLKKRMASTAPSRPLPEQPPPAGRQRVRARGGDAAFWGVPWRADSKHAPEPEPPPYVLPRSSAELMRSYERIAQEREQQDMQQQQQQQQRARIPTQQQQQQIYRTYPPAPRPHSQPQGPLPPRDGVAHEGAPPPGAPPHAYHQDAELMHSPPSMHHAPPPPPPPQPQPFEQQQLPPPEHRPRQRAISPVQWRGDGRMLPNAEHEYRTALLASHAPPPRHAADYSSTQGRHHLLADPAPSSPSSPGTKCLAAAASTLYGGEAELLRSAFDKFDARRLGWLEDYEVLQALRHLGFELSHGYRRAVLGQYDAAGRLTLAQFVAVARGCAEAADDALKREGCYDYLVRVCTGGPIRLDASPPPPPLEYLYNTYRPWPG